MLKNAGLLTLGLALLVPGSGVWAQAPASPAPAVEEPLLKTTPYLQAMSQNSVIITWHTSRPAYSWVDYRPEGSTEPPMNAISSTYGLKDVGLVQKITLSDLQPGVTYTYSISSREVKEIQPYKFTFGKEATLREKNGKPLSFTTWPEEADTFSFVMINDLHDGNEKHANLIRATDVPTADFVCYNGDIVTDKNQGGDIIKFFLQTAVDSYAWEKPFFMLRGNHETRGAFSRNLHEFFPTQTDQFYYTFTYGDVFFVNLDCGEDKTDDSKEYGGLVDFDSYRSEQIPWLEKVVQLPAYKNARYRVFFCHIPPSGGGEQNVEVDLIKADGSRETQTDFSKAWHGEKEIRDKFLPILLDNKADLLLCGHTHKLLNCEYRRGNDRLPVLINSNVDGVRIDVNPERIFMKVVNQKGEEVITKEVRPRSEQKLVAPNRGQKAGKTLVQ
jgi:predicted phosphodiesterase